MFGQSWNTTEGKWLERKMGRNLRAVAAAGSFAQKVRMDGTGWDRMLAKRQAEWRCKSRATKHQKIRGTVRDLFVNGSRDSSD